MNGESHHEFNEWTHYLCEIRKYALMVLREYIIISPLTLNKKT